MNHEKEYLKFQIAVEAIENIRTVAVLSVEQKILDSYVGKLIAPKKLVVFFFYTVSLQMFWVLTVIAFRR